MYSALLLLSILCTQLGAQEGYRLLPDRVETNTQAQWSVWQAPIGTRVFAADGSVSPRFLRRDINAARNADAFTYVSEGDTLTGGIFSAGSNLERAPLAIDGDDTTYWEPELDRPHRRLVARYRFGPSRGTQAHRCALCPRRRSAAQV